MPNPRSNNPLDLPFIPASSIPFSISAGGEILDEIHALNRNSALRKNKNRLVNLKRLKDEIRTVNGEKVEVVDNWDMEESWEKGRRVDDGVEVVVKYLKVTDVKIGKRTHRRVGSRAVNGPTPPKPAAREPLANARSAAVNVPIPAVDQANLPAEHIPPPEIPYNDFPIHINAPLINPQTPPRRAGPVNPPHAQNMDITPSTSSGSLNSFTLGTESSQESLPASPSTAPAARAGDRIELRPAPTRGNRKARQQGVGAEQNGGLPRQADQQIEDGHDIGQQQQQQPFGADHHHHQQQQQQQQREQGQYQHQLQREQHQQRAHQSPHHIGTGGLGQALGSGRGMMVEEDVQPSAVAAEEDVHMMEMEVDGVDVLRNQAERQNAMMVVWRNPVGGIPLPHHVAPQFQPPPQPQGPHHHQHHTRTAPLLLPPHPPHPGQRAQETFGRGRESQGGSQRQRRNQYRHRPYPKSRPTPKPRSNPAFQEEMQRQILAQHGEAMAGIGRVQAQRHVEVVRGMNALETGMRHLTGEFMQQSGLYNHDTPERDSHHQRHHQANGRPQQQQQQQHHHHHGAYAPHPGPQHPHGRGGGRPRY